MQMMADLDTELNTRVREETEYMESERVRGHDRMAHLEEMVKKEREDRISSLEGQLEPIRANLRDIQTATDAERNARVQKEREILDILRDESAKVVEALTIEKETRLAKQAELYLKVSTEIKRENMWVENFQKNTMSEFAKDRSDIEREMDNRFHHQDLIVKDVQHFISTFQKTLKAVGDKS